jgi:hypothetical protein
MQIKLFRRGDITVHLFLDENAQEDSAGDFRGDDSGSIHFIALISIFLSEYGVCNRNHSIPLQYAVGIVEDRK